MELRRTTPNPFNKNLGDLIFRPEGFACNGEVVTASFPRFGEGPRRQSDFEVRLSWDDIERTMQEFCRVGHPQALAFQEAMKLAAAAKELGWQQPPQSN